MSGAFLIAALLAEMVVGQVVGYPRYGVDFYVEGLDYRNWDKSRVYKPYSRYMVTEGRNRGKVFQRNNFGFPGDDLYPEASAVNIAVIGSSFIEAQQVQPSQIATSILQRKIRDRGARVNVVNLGYRGGNPLNLYRRLKYWDERFAFNHVVLLIDHYPFQGLPRHLDIVANLPTGWDRDVSIFHNAYRIARNVSALVNLYVPGLRQSEASPNSRPVNPGRSSTPMDFGPLIETFFTYSREGSRMLVLSLADVPADYKEEMHLQLRRLSSEYRVPVHICAGPGPGGRINNGGHYNEAGNAYVAEAISRALEEATVQTETAGNQNMKRGSF